MPVLKYTPSSYIRENLFILYLVGLPTGVYCAGAEDGFFVSDLSVIDVFEVSGFAVVVSAFVVCVDVAAVVTAVVCGVTVWGTGVVDDVVRLSGFMPSGFLIVLEQPHIPTRIDAAQINNSAFFIGLSFLPLLSADVEEYRTVWTLW